MSRRGFQIQFMRIHLLLLPVAALVAVSVGDVAVAQEAPTPKTVQKPAAQVIQKQEKPKVVPRVMEKVSPDITRIVVSLSKQRAVLFVGEEVAIDTPVSTGKRKGMTPAGQFAVMEKDADHRSSLYGDFVNSRGAVVRGGVSTRIDSAPSGTRFRGAPMKYFLRLTGDGVGMHIGILPGYPASHGCIRLPADIAPLIYNAVKVGTVVVIEE